MNIDMLTVLAIIAAYVIFVNKILAWQIYQHQKILYDSKVSEAIAISREKEAEYNIKMARIEFNIRRQVSGFESKASSSYPDAYAEALIRSKSL